MDGIRIYEKNPFYFQYKNKPVLLLGGSIEDNLFQIRDLEEHLDLLKSVGGNYVRCTMSSRDEGDVWAFRKDPETGLYDLKEWDEEYWNRLERFLTATKERDIIPQLEIWATWDFYKHAGDPWLINAWNPKNNSTYTEEQSGLCEEWDYYAPERINPFFETVPALNNNELLLALQTRFVEKLLSISLQYNHILYVMDNETNADPEWGFYWNRYVKGKAADAGVHIETSEMWDNWDPSDGQVPGARQQAPSNHPFLSRSNPLVTIAHAEEYSFVDISNHNAQQGEVHWNTGQFIRNKIIETGKIRPITCDKMYGGPLNSEFSGNDMDGLERFWRNIFGGLASCRFHRPTAGLGLSEPVQKHIRSMRMLTDEMDVFSCEPLFDKLSDREENSCYCFGNDGVEYAVVFLDGGSVTLDTSACSGKLTLRWLDIEKSEWSEEKETEPGSLRLESPGKGFRACLVK